jgi:hypothetical protein
VIEIYTMFKEIGKESRCLEQISFFLCKEKRQELESMKYIINDNPNFHQTFWNFFDFPPLDQLSVRSDTTSRLSTINNRDDIKNAIVEFEYLGSKTSIGIVNFVREDGMWKIHSEVWDESRD